ncbi:hypothetical protein PHACT_01155 [Pseudohongiella acticola]|uniref:Sulfur relay protein DsrH n=1 Tax=Pseudohongiella acticola TaxID=1524254 RepID=A0A1E8CHN6_9GAMM|nr:sulfurtransferase complex subunit TusB [Pseudohongiella acticola]OFE11919.1 hypothetical protein PHACT_01155 [Pseudohongiella acticola]
MSTLHIVSKSPFRTDALQRCLALVGAGDSIILIEDGVLAVNQTALTNAIASLNIRCFALSDDLAARSLGTDGTAVSATDMAGFVQLVCEHRNSLTHA